MFASGTYGSTVYGSLSGVTPIKGYAHAVVASGIVSAFETLTAQGKASELVSGFETTFGMGSFQVTGRGSNKTLPGGQLTFHQGSITPRGKGCIPVEGLLCNIALTNPQAVAKSKILVPSFDLIGSIGDVIALGKSSALVSGVGSILTVGQVNAAARTIIEISGVSSSFAVGLPVGKGRGSALPAGVESVLTVSQAIGKAKGVVTIVGLQATFGIGSVGSPERHYFVEISEIESGCITFKLKSSYSDYSEIYSGSVKFTDIRSIGDSYDQNNLSMEITI